MRERVGEKDMDKILSDGCLHCKTCCKDVCWVLFRLFCVV